MATNPPKRSKIPLDQCNLARAIEQMGDRWTLLILRSAFYGLRRFGDFQAELSIPRTVLSGRLRSLVENDILEIRQYREPGQRPRPEYFMTDKGADLAIAMIALNQWGDRWLGEEGHRPLTFHLKIDGSTIEAALTADKAHQIPMNQVSRMVHKK
ncbi:MAG: winged helix-turn-helix transcriptional regulator [bacterium]